MKYPEIRIQDGWLLRENASNHLHELWGRGKKLADDKSMASTVKAYQDTWKPYEKKILTGMCEMLGLEFRQNIIDVYIAPWFFAFSNPMVIGVIYEPDLFIDILTHELVHRLLTDNTTLAYDTRLMSHWQKLYGENHSFGMIVHVPVYAVNKAIYLDVLKQPERLERERRRTASFQLEDYVKSSAYVDKSDYKQIVSDLKKLYLKLGSK